MWSCRWPHGCGHVGGLVGVVMQETDLGSTEIYHTYIHMYVYILYTV